MNEQPLSLPASLREIWRRRLLVIAVAALCGLAGVIFGILKPQDTTAVALVLLPPSAASSSGAPANLSHTDAVIASSTPVLAAAGARVSPPLTVTALQKLVTVKALGGQILQVQARARQGGYAEQLANAVAQSYVKYTGQLATTSAGPELAGLQKQSAQLTRQINSLQSQIDTVSARIASELPGSSAGLQDSNLLSSLRNEQNQNSLQLNGVTGQISALQLASGSAASTTQILQKAAAVPVDNSLPRTAGLLGFVLGLFGSAVFVLVRVKRDHRLRVRDELAQAAGAPVIASIEAPTCTTPTAWRELLESRPRATAEWALRNVLHRYEKEGRPRGVVRVISFAGDSAGFTTGPRLALHAAASGMTTVLVPEDPHGAENRSLGTLRAAFTGAEPVGRGLPLTMGPNDPDDGPPQLLVSLVVFDGEEAMHAPSGEEAMHAPSDSLTLLSISANTVTADEVAQLALEAADGGTPLDGVVVVNPDPTDNTSGFVVGDALRLLPSNAPRDRGISEPVRFEALTANANGSSTAFRLGSADGHDDV